MWMALMLAAALLPAEWTLAGQEATCAKGPRARTFELASEEKIVDLGDGTRFAAMTLGGRLAPVLEACEGDTVTLKVTNAGEMAHGLDAHALRMDMRKFGPVDSGQTLVLSGFVSTPGAFMFHCAAGPVTDVHIKSGMWGAIVVYPRKRLPKAIEVAVLQGGIFGKPGEDGVIHGDPAMMARNEPS
ncbi:MAG: multicopper oxidase domain-containing protein, partial [Deltaproteobacteria bacterium]|nr:multicopper oxidase domain-containing protein [Deltaproteobacteria bacterium]